MLAMEAIYMNIKAMGKRYGYRSGHAICARCMKYPQCLDPKRLPEAADKINCPYEKEKQ